MNNDYYVYLGEEVAGPFTLGQIKSMWSHGQITLETLFSLGDANWNQLEIMREQLEPSPILHAVPVVAPVTVPKTSEAKKVVIILIILAIAIGGGIIALSHNPASTDVSTLPLQITYALNNLKSATDTGINRNDYTQLVIALKTAQATYGQSLPPERVARLENIAADYGMTVELWNLSYANDEGISEIRYKNDIQIQLWFDKIGLKLPHGYDDNYNDIPTKETMSAVWSYLNLEVSQL